MATKNEVLALYGQGCSIAEIADRLGCMTAYVRATLRRAGITRSDTVKSLEMKVAYHRAKMRDAERVLADLRARNDE